MLSTTESYRGRTVANVDLSEPELGAAGWALQGLRGGPMPEKPREPLTPDWHRSPEQAWSLLGAMGSLDGGDFEITATKRTREGDDILIEFDLLSSAGKRSVMRCFIEPGPPYRLLTFGVGRPLGEGYTVRAATPSDGLALAELEASVPIESGRSTISIDRGSHYWDHMMLMNSQVTVAEHGGEIVAAMANVFIPLMADGTERSLTYLHHGRVHPDHQGGGLGRAMMGRAMEPDMPLVVGDGGAFLFIASTNGPALAPWPEEARWQTRPQRLLFDVAKLAGEPKGAIGTPKDAARVMSLLNGCHEKEELFLPYNEDRLTERLARVPSAYSWAQLRVQNDAVIGIGGATERRKHTDPDGAMTETCRASILDFGFAGERGWESFEALLRGACGEFVDSEVTHLTLFSSPGSPGYARLRALASAEETYVLITVQVDEPEAAVRDGTYIDHLYF